MKKMAAKALKEVEEESIKEIVMYDSLPSPHVDPKATRTKKAIKKWVPKKIDAMQPIQEALIHAFLG